MSFQTHVAGSGRPSSKSAQDESMCRTSSSQAEVSSQVTTFPVTPHRCPGASPSVHDYSHTDWRRLAHDLIAKEKELGERGLSQEAGSRKPAIPWPHSEALTDSVPAGVRAHMEVIRQQ